MVAIVIPAYKLTYLEEALSSIAAQTDRRFKLYIGDDASPENLYEIVAKFESRIPLSYIRFNENIGQKSLVSHWHRCIDLIKEEQWIWLFGDDDIMEPTCLETFYKALDEQPTYDLYKFNTMVIDKDGVASTKRLGSFAEVVTSQDFLKSRLKWQNNSYVVEYIFRRKVYESVAGFPDFATALASDDAFWAMVSLRSGIKSMSGPFVKWRYSGSNISSLRTDAKEKIKGALQYMYWLKHTYPHYKQLTEELQVTWLAGIFFNFKGHYNVRWLIGFVMGFKGLSAGFKAKSLLKYLQATCKGYIGSLKRIIKK